MALAPILKRPHQRHIGSYPLATAHACRTLHRALRRMAGLVFLLGFWVLAGACHMARRGRVLWCFFVPLGGACPPSGARSGRRPLECAIHHHHRPCVPKPTGAALFPARVGTRARCPRPATSPCVSRSAVCTFPGIAVDVAWRTAARARPARQQRARRRRERAIVTSAAAPLRAPPRSSYLRRAAPHSSFFSASAS